MPDPYIILAAIVSAVAALSLYNLVAGHRRAKRAAKEFEAVRARMDALPKRGPDGKFRKSL